MKGIRTLKIKDVGDYAKKTNHPEIKLSGNWLREAGLSEGYVTVESPKPGTLIVKLANQIQNREEQ